MIQYGFEYNGSINVINVDLARPSPTFEDGFKSSHHLH